MPKEHDKTVGGTGDKAILAMLDAFWKTTRYAHNGNVSYKGTSIYKNADPSAEDWEIWKYHYSSGRLIRVDGPLQGAWNDREALGWEGAAFEYIGTLSEEQKISSLLEQILIEQKKTNLHLMSMTGEEIKEFDL